MESYSHYLRTKKNTKDASSWMANKDKTDSQDRQPYTLAKIVFQAEYCSQSYAGANNYHDSPAEFNSAMAEVIKSNFESLAAKALEILLTKERAALVACKDDLAAVQAEIAEAESAA